jgi:hypothetical protein
MTDNASASQKVTETKVTETTVESPVEPLTGSAEQAGATAQIPGSVSKLPEKTLDSPPADKRIHSSDSVRK